MVNEAVERLSELGYTCTEEDKEIIDGIISRLIISLISLCNVEFLPTVLEAVVVERACGEFLDEKTVMGEGESLVQGGILKELAIGDTKLSYDTSSSKSGEQRLQDFIGQMRGYGKEVVDRCRQMRW